MASLEGKHFSITDPKDVNTVIYRIQETEKEYRKDSPKYTVERLASMSELRGENTRRTYFVDNPSVENDQLVILSFAKDRVVVNSGLLGEDKIKIAKQPSFVKFDTLYSDETEYKEFNYTPNLKRPISIIDPETTEEIKPVLYFDEKTNEVKGKCKLKPHKSYFAFEIRDKN